MRSRVSTVVWTGVAALIVAGVAGTILDWLWQGHLVRRSIGTVQEHFPIGMPFSEALTRVRHDYAARNSNSTANACTKEAAMTEPTYPPQGGPCIFGIEETGSTWWGFESAVQFRLLFDSGGKLRVVQAFPVYTFL
jgi:hypothetical protein